MINPRVKPFYQRHKKALLIGGAAFIAVVCAVYVIWSKHSWDTYKTSSTQQYAALKSDIKKAITAPDGSPDERTKKLELFKEVAANSRDFSNNCEVQGLISWQMAITSVKTYKEDCKRIGEKAKLFGVEASNLVTYLEKERELTAVILTAATTQPSLGETDFEAQQVKWRTAYEQAQKLPQSFQLKQEVLAAIQGAEGAWGQLIAAHKAKDKLNYLKAQTQLGSSYDALTGLTSKSTEYVTEYTKKFETAYEAL